MKKSKIKSIIKQRRRADCYLPNYYMKKIFSLILVISTLLCICTGCSQSELAYLEILNDIKDAKVLTFTGDMQIATPDAIDVKFLGNLDNSDRNNIYLDLNINVEYPAESISIRNGKVIIKDDKVYLSKNLVKELLIIEETANYANSFEKIIAEKDYILIQSEDNDISEMKQMVELEKNIFSPEIVEEFKKVFKNFETGIAKENNNTITITISRETILNLIDNFINFIDTDKEELFDAALIIVGKYYDATISTLKELDAQTVAEMPTKEEVLIEMEMSRQGVYNAIDELVKEYHEFGKEELRQSLEEELKTFNLKQEIYNNQPEYEFITNLTFPYTDYVSVNDPRIDATGIVYKEIKCSSDIMIKIMDKVQKQEVSNSIDINVAIEEANKNYSKTFPAKTMEITWYSNNTVSYVNIINAEDREIYETYPITLKDDRIYLPLRKICEAFGETVEWDAINNKAYIIRGNQKIDMTGIIENNLTMIKVRDFEKLGYTVEYRTSEFGENIATITKN